MHSAMNLMLSGINDIQSALDADIDMSSFEGAKECLKEAETAAKVCQEQIEALKQSSQNIPPVKVPVTYDFENVGPLVFTNTGVERFNQEIANANTLMENLIATQSTINSNSASVLRPNQTAELNNTLGRLTAIQQRIQQIENNPVNIGSDTANAGLEYLRTQLYQATQAQTRLNSALTNMDPATANAEYARLVANISSAERYIRDNVSEQGKFNQEIAKGTNATNGLLSKLKGITAAYLSIKGAGQVLGLSDEVTQTQARLNLLLDNFNETGSVDDLFKKIYASAQDARGSLTDTAAVVARFGNNAKDAFSGSDEVVAFANLVQKQMTIAGATTSEASNAMLQLSQALGSGVLRGDELNSIFENAPNLIQNIADYLGKPIGEIREMAADGMITADVVKNAIFEASDEINERFEKMPLTWGQMWTKFQNTATMAFKPVLDRLNELANSEGFQNFVTGAIEVLAVLADVVIDIFEAIGNIAGFVAQNWNVIGPIIYGVAAALAIYYGWLLLIKAIELISTGVKIALCMASFAHAAATGTEASATAAATAAQYGLNTAILSCPIFWIIILIIALIAILIALCNWIADVTGVAQSALGIICGALAVAGAFIGNLFIALINIIIDIFVVLWNFIAAFANFFANVFNDPVGAIARLFFDLVDCILELLQSLASAIDTIFGSNLANSVQGWRDGLSGWVDDTFGKGEEVMAKVNAEDYHLDRFEYSGAWNAGVEFGDNVSSAISDKISGVSDWLKNNAEDLLNPTTDSGEDALNGIKANTDDIKKEVKHSDDILSMIKDSVSKERIANYTTKQITVDMSGMSNQIASSLSIGDVVREMEKRITEAAAVSVEGV
jgi:tape measure domain-containing protein